MMANASIDLFISYNVLPTLLSFLIGEEIHYSHSWKDRKRKKNNLINGKKERQKK